jgi:DNA-binding SARP family transcriptional activator/TolB-like protein
VITIARAIVSSDTDRAVIAAPRLRLSLFGQMQAMDAAGSSVLPRSRKTRGVLAVLALAAPKPVLRSTLTGMLWSRRAKEQARGSLRQSVHELQRVLGASAGAALHTDRNHLVLLEDGLWVDVRVLAGATATNPLGLRLFRPTLLDDLDGLDPVFDGWITEQSQRLTQRALSVAEAVLAAAREVTTRIEAAEQLLTIARTHEHAWQALIHAHIERGDLTAARLAFEQCSATLSYAGLAPSREVEALIRGTSHRQSARAGYRKLREGGQGIRVCVLQPRMLDGSGLDRLLPGLAEEITAAVSRFRWISCFEEPQRTRQSELTDHEANTDYVLDSTVQRAGQRARIIVRLFDLHAGRNIVWARRFDREVDDVLMIQGDIAAETAAQIDLELLLREGQRRSTTDRAEATALDLTLSAVPAIYRLERSAFHTAGELLDAAVAMEPDNAAAHAWWAYWHMFLVGQAWAKDPLAATTRAGDLAERAVTLDPGDARALALAGHVRGFLHKRAEEACTLHDRALSLNPNLPLAWCLSGMAECYIGRHERAIERISRAYQLSPHDPYAFLFDTALMMPHFLRGEFDIALTLGRRAVELNPRFTSTYMGYLATLGQLGQADEAARVRARLLALEPGFSIRKALERSPMIRQADRDLYAQGLRGAGLRES